MVIRHVERQNTAIRGGEQGKRYESKERHQRPTLRVGHLGDGVVAERGPHVRGGHDPQRGRVHRQVEHEHQGRDGHSTRRGSHVSRALRRLCRVRSRQWHHFDMWHGRRQFI